MMFYREEGEYRRHYYSYRSVPHRLRVYARKYRLSLTDNDYYASWKLIQDVLNFREKVMNLSIFHGRLEYDANLSNGLYQF